MPDRAKDFQDSLNKYLGQYQPLTIVLSTTGALLGAYAVGRFVNAAREHPGGASGVVFGSLVNAVKSIPMAKEKIEETKKELVSKIKKGMPKLQEDVHLPSF
jgi:hypothetical protein